MPQATSLASEPLKTSNTIFVKVGVEIMFCFSLKGIVIEGLVPMAIALSMVRAETHTHCGAMGCGLRKMKPMSEENSPGKIYSTLKRPQVETKVGVAYTYRYLDFLIGKDDWMDEGAGEWASGGQAGFSVLPRMGQCTGGTSTLRLSSVRELPGQLQELYQQGFVLASVHPFIHPCGPESNSPQHQLYRAILIRLNDGVERSQPVCPPYKLQLEECLSAEQVPTPELIQGYVKKFVVHASNSRSMMLLTRG
ncbi:hypothetical protein F7725_018297 [Dissostichus mawsoni]|uniref:Uncharacterized protein n=1 Tax=Dissostichus mawsoni TaxID=36200 RepID=A0A7J5XR81_DISMA|nr:hypothetical protein F7725_018297 [Dissostichus mawsoni]